MSRTILHADMDAFFAAVEARDDPSIASEPVVVGADPRGGRGRGVVAACNYPARAFGIHSAMPISEAYRRCPGAVFLRPRLHLYAEVSERVMEIFETFTELVEKISIDEAFLDVTGSGRLFGDGVAIAEAIKREVRERERLTVSIGVAPNKFLAKLASDIDKPDGLTVVEPGSEESFLQPLPVERLWGVGDVTAAKLHKLGIWKIGDIAASPAGLLERHFGRHHGERLRRLSVGADERPVETGGERKQISRETTFLTDTHDRELVERTMLGLTEEVAARLRRRRLAAHTVTIKLRLAPFETHTRRHTVESDLFTTESIFPIACQLFRSADPGDRPIRLIGVGVSALHKRQTETQLGLFEGDERPDTDAQVADLMDRVSERFGRDALKRGKLLGPLDPDDSES
ncbi:MAG: DNA polymerase IV [Gemmatimonadetes bacterium]|nr:DNA polymerase IV [Gemmatimonadota bacterium]